MLLCKIFFQIIFLNEIQDYLHLSSNTRLLETGQWQLVRQVQLVPYFLSCQCNFLSSFCWFHSAKGKDYRISIWPNFLSLPELLSFMDLICILFLTSPIYYHLHFLLLVSFAPSIINNSNSEYSSSLKDVIFEVVLRLPERLTTLPVFP